MSRRLILGDVEEINEFALPLHQLVVALLMLENCTGQPFQFTHVLRATGEFVTRSDYMFFDAPIGMFE